MRQHGLAWLLALPLVTAGSLASHTLAYRIAEPVAGTRADLLQTTGHGYMSAAPFFLAVGIAFLAAGLLSIGARSRRGAATTPACWPLAFVAPLGFALQEYLERLVATGSFPLDLVAQPVFVTGLALQLPFALIAVVAARWLSRAAEAVGRALARSPTALPRCAVASPSLVSALLPRRPALATGCGVRGPPRVA
jgi:hypothetical protein